jgi:hypothetical protein
MDVPKIVRDTTTQRWSRRRFMGGAVGVAALGSFAAACDSGANQSARAPTSGAPASPVSGTSTNPGSTTTTSDVDAELIRQRYHGLKPFAPAPTPPTVKPIRLSVSDPKVFSRAVLVGAARSQKDRTADHRVLAVGYVRVDRLSSAGG